MELADELARLGHRNRQLFRQTLGEMDGKIFVDILYNHHGAI